MKEKTRRWRKRCSCRRQSTEREDAANKTILPSLPSHCIASSPHGLLISLPSNFIALLYIYHDLLISWPSNFTVFLFHCLIVSVILTSLPSRLTAFLPVYLLTSLDSHFLACILTLLLYCIIAFSPISLFISLHFHLIVLVITKPSHLTDFSHHCLLTS